MTSTHRNETEALWKAEDVAVFLGMHVQTVYAKAKAGEIPSRKIGRAVRFVPREIRSLVDPTPAAEGSAA